ncbi:MAG: efflux RND transporter periplasmic adaptor subunit [Xanthobacteraceae bacterium]|nr:efflux RND transporter periplasmic adaptor subunit [Xanthobacteraceae bacterium]
MTGILSALRFSAGLIAAALMLSACTEGPAAPTAETAAPQEVSVLELQPAPLPVIRELPGRIAPTRIAEVRARVSGIVVHRNFEQGSDVKAGDVLYELDAEPFRIELNATEAALAKAQAVLNQETQNHKRAEALWPTRAIAQSQLDVAIANLKQAEADVAARKADVDRAKLNLERTKIRAPISGRAGRALVTEGALVQADLTHTATIQQLTSIYADFTQSVNELNQLRREFDSGELERVSAAKVRLILDNGEVYPYEGTLLFSDVTVDPGTGQVTLRGEFPNPKLAVLPGMYVRVQIEQGIDPDALAVPQQAVRRSDSGGSEIFLVREDNRAAVAAIRLGRAVEDRWLILDGAKPGDRVIVDGFQKFVAGDLVDPRPWSSRKRSASADGGVTAR